jgi:hypothetical protein
MRTLSPVLLAAALLLSAPGCRDKEEDCFDPFNPACADYDPCLQKFRTEAEFGLWDRWGIDFQLFRYLPYRDTIPILRGGGKRIYFRAADPRMSAYEWRVGLDPRTFHDSVFYLDFYDASGWIEASLKVQHDGADTGCYPGDSGEATYSKSFYLLPYTAQTRAEELAYYPIFGEYLGHDEGNPQDTFRMSIQWPTDLPPGIYNFPDGCSRINTGTAFSTHYFLVDDGPGNQVRCSNPNIYATLLPGNRELVVDYSIVENGQRVQRRWVGVKLE